MAKLNRQWKDSGWLFFSWALRWTENLKEKNNNLGLSNLMGICNSSIYDAVMTVWKSRNYCFTIFLSMQPNMKHKGLRKWYSIHFSLLLFVSLKLVGIKFSISLHSPLRFYWPLQDHLSCTGWVVGADKAVMHSMVLFSTFTGGLASFIAPSGVVKK